MKKVVIGLLIIMAFSNVQALAIEFNESGKLRNTEILQHGEEDLEEKKEIENVNEKRNINNESSLDVNREEKSLINEIYEVEEKTTPKTKGEIFLDENGFERKEFKDDAEGIEKVSYLKKKTSEAFEIAIAKDDGSYVFLKSFDSYEKAKSFIELDEDISGNLTIIDENGMIIYAEEAMGRIIKHINGVPQTNYSKTTDLYSDSALKNAHTYINHGYIDDVPIINDSGKSAKVMVSGYSGWIKKDTSSSEYDLIVVPLNHVVNPSYYIVENGELNHFLSSDVKTQGKGYKIKLGKAPNFLSSNKKYYSYDGSTFYNSLKDLLSDLKNNSTAKAVNKTLYYSYYQNLPFRSKTNYTASEINKFIEDNTVKDSKLRNTGKDFIDAQNTYGVNALLALGVAINESGWGTSTIAKEKNNLFGLKATDANPGQDASKFNTVRDSIFNFAKGYISLGYSNSKDWRYYGAHLGNKNLGINVKYASDPFWGEKANNHVYTADYKISGGKLKDNNYYKLGIYNTSTGVKKQSGEQLYKAKEGTPTILIDSISLNGEESYSVYPDRPVMESESFSGEYLWNSRGYIGKKTVSLVNSGLYDGSFSDVPEDFWAKKEIDRFYSKGYISGYDDGTFRPNNPISRAEFIKLINRHFGYENKKEVENFHDIEKGPWFYEEVNIALNAGYIDSKNKNFRPRDYITREEVAAILTTIKKCKDTNLDKLDEYLDKDRVSQWALSSVEGAIEKGYMGKGESKKFRPKDNITRAESVVAIDRIEVN